MPPNAHDDDDDSFDEIRNESGSSIYRLFREYGRKHWPQFFGGAAASILQMAMELVPAFVLAIAIDSLFFDTRAFALPLVPEAWLPEAQGAQFLLAAGLVGGSYALNTGLGWINDYMWNGFAQHFQHNVRVDSYDAMQRRELSFFDNRQTGEVMSVLNNDVNQLENFLTGDLNTIITVVVRVGGMGVVMLAINWRLALIPVAAIPILAYLSYKFRELIHPKYQRVRKSVGQMNSRLENNVGGIQTVKAYTTEPFETGRVEDASREYLDAQWDAIMARITFFPTLAITTQLSYVLVFLIGGWWVVTGSPPHPFFNGPNNAMTAGTLVLFLNYTRRFSWPMRRVGEVLNNYQYAEAAGERITGLLDLEPRVKDAPDATPLDDLEGRVEFDDVNFSYENDEGDPEQVLRDISFSVEPGEYVGLVGPTGAGKSTLMKLLLRFYDPDDGDVRIDGVDVDEVTLQSLRDSIGYVNQEPFLFYGTARDNIAYGLDDADDDEMYEAARIAGAHEFVEELPDGYDTMVGERGVKLSGGQRQRIALARAILRDPEIMILDEATSHVDNETEAVIQNNLSGMIADRTTFAIAHRLSTVRDADTILVLEDGEIVERGTHDELIDEDGMYADLWNVQVGDVEALPEEFVERTKQGYADRIDTE
ncbi:ATP-binding cassette, subfamily B [Natronoarchaeum philippinense]|uniref:ATP-binding cassette, subfamily B n=1 Tax=Natronoarchaeum philippinense TaxID=558529 RepID=A0A285P5T6_NATPI|nr:ABC transporter ATP-binding protein [Natronoarchaeum philippinense]SNZ17090.1 ATP-binding cassette, subfamily B [Natronoarchaeum philippinense]